MRPASIGHGCLGILSIKTHWKRSEKEYPRGAARLGKALAFPKERGNTTKEYDHCLRVVLHFETINCPFYTCCGGRVRTEKTGLG
jgi:hypothetical protein